MEIRSLSYSTLIYQLSFSSIITDRGDYRVISTPNLPYYYWGNFLLFQDPPAGCDADKWEALFKDEFRESDCTHMAFAWDSIEGEAGVCGAFEKRGYYFEFDDILMTQEAIRPGNYNDKISVRPLESNADWEMRAELNLACDQTLNLEQIENLGEHYRADTRQFRGIFLGAFLDGTLVGEMALFKGGQQTSLISMVKTHPEYRKQGVCRTLLFHTVQIGKELFRFKDFVMVADTLGPGRSVYEAVGFKIVEKGASLIKKDTLH